MYIQKVFCNFYILANKILFKQIVYFVRILVVHPVQSKIFFPKRLGFMTNVDRSSGFTYDFLCFGLL